MRKPLILTQTVQFTLLKVFACKRRETLKTTMRTLIATLESKVSYFHKIQRGYVPLFSNSFYASTKTILDRASVQT